MAARKKAHWVSITAKSGEPGKTYHWYKIISVISFWTPIALPSRQEWSPQTGRSIKMFHGHRCPCPWS